MLSVPQFASLGQCCDRDWIARTIFMQLQSESEMESYFYHWVRQHQLSPVCFKCFKRPSLRMVELRAQESNHKKQRGSRREEGNCNQGMQITPQHTWNRLSKTAHHSGSAIRSTEWQRLTAVSKDGECSSVEARPWVAKVVSAGRSSGPRPLGLLAAPSPCTSCDVV